MKRTLSVAIFLAAGATLAWATSAGAVDGTIEINQAKAMAAGGFPYKITSGGSYRLTGNLTAPASTNAINVTASNVTVDLNGFSITGPGSSGGTPIGINASVGGVTVENGTVTGFGVGVSVGSFGIVRNVHADANGNGIDAGSNSVIEGCTANNSTQASGDALNCSAGCLISGNTANSNADDGIVCQGSGCVISGNTANANTTNFGTAITCNGLGCLISGNVAFNNLVGIVAADSTTGYEGNVLKNTTNVSGSATSMGHNLCNGSVC